MFHLSLYVAAWLSAVLVAEAGAWPIAVLIICLLPLIVLHKRIGCFTAAAKRWWLEEMHY